MITHFYVTEPEEIDLAFMQELLKEHPVSISEGTVDFVGSDSSRYEVLVIRSETNVDEHIKRHFPHLRSIIRIGTGLDNVDMKYCKRAGIQVYNAAGANAKAVAEYIVAMVLLSLRRISHLETEDLLEWNRFKFRGQSFDSQAVGLIGFGHIGRSVSQIVSSFGCQNILVYDPFITQADLPVGATKLESLEELLQISSVVSIQVPLTEATRNLLDKEKFAYLKPDAILVNVSHGGVVDEEAMLTCLEDGAQFTYIADTVLNEPHGDKRLFNHDKVIITPHIASLTYSSEKEMMRVAVQNYINKNPSL